MKISVLGCGWLGLPLAKKLVASGHVVKGTTTSRDKMTALSNEGITPYSVQVYSEGINGDITSFLSDAELLIITIPPGLRADPESNYVGKIGRLQDFIEKSGVEKVLFISSTSVYKDTEDISEYTAEITPNAKSTTSEQIIGAENSLKNSDSYLTTVLRFGGLLGPGRHPVNYISGKKGLKNAAAPVNLIQLDDCIGIIEAIIEKEAWGETFIAAYPQHPSKQEYYTQMAQDNNMAIPEFDETSASKGKIINSDQLVEKLDYKFRSPI
jgi:nucleoside-diphosphate-sugar epimerase